MKKITVKIFASITLGFFVITLIPRLFFFRFVEEIEISEIINSNTFGYGMAITSFLSFFGFFIIMNELVVKRIKKLNLAVNQVAQGDYDLYIQSKGRDEISTLTHHFNQMVNELKLKEKMNQEFLRNFAHEFKTPIATFKGYADLIISEEENINQIHEYAKIISDEAIRLTTLSKDMLFMSRIDSETLIKHQEPFDLSKQIKNITTFMQLDWESKNLNLEFDLEPVILSIDEAYTYHIISNIMSNAIKFSKPSGHISCSLKDQIDQFELIINDDGKGMDESELSHVFEPFYMADKAHNALGSGIGLTLVKRIVDHLNGNIQINSVKNEYTEIKINMPKKSENRM